MCFGQTKFPWAAGILDRRQWTGACAAVISRDRNQIRVGFNDARGNRADAGFRNQFDRDECLRIYLLQIKYQLGKVFDGLNIVVGWG